MSVPVRSGSASLWPQDRQAKLENVYHLKRNSLFLNNLLQTSEFAGNKLTFISRIKTSISSRQRFNFSCRLVCNVRCWITPQTLSQWFWRSEIEKSCLNQLELIYLSWLILISLIYAVWLVKVDTLVCWCMATKTFNHEQWWWKLDHKFQGC